MPRSRREVGRVEKKGEEERVKWREKRKERERKGEGEG